jgi:hypothetical protein
MFTLLLKVRRRSQAECDIGLPFTSGQAGADVFSAGKWLAPESLFSSKENSF